MLEVVVQENRTRSKPRKDGTIVEYTTFFITIPKQIALAMGLKRGTKLSVQFEDGKLCLKKKE